MDDNQDSRKTKLDHNLGYLINRTAWGLKHAMQKAINEKELGITTNHWAILQQLDETDGLSQIELAKILEKDRPNVTRILDVMQKKQLVIRKADPNDRRKYLIYLTDKGKEIKAQIEPLSIAVREEAFEHISGADLKKLRKLMIQITNNLM
ncbi:MAG: MarR family winged helix-turn-helix transcriptional regulator [Calditrichia bacterium]